MPLDPGMVVESLILKRLDTLPKRRHPDWIRALLVQGFLAESRVVRQLGASASQSATGERRAKPSARWGFDFSDWGQRSTNATRVVSATPAVPTREAPHCVESGGSDKPFAQLRKVVG